MYIHRSVRAAVPGVRPRRWVAMTPALVLLGGLVLSCRAAGAPMSAPAPTRSLDASPSHFVHASGCADIVVFIDYVPLSLDNVALASDAIVVGTFTGYGPSAWNTPGGVAPVTISAGSAAHLYRPVRIVVEQTFRGSATLLAAARTDGGDLGCVHYRVEPDPALEVGHRYVLFFSPAQDSGGRLVAIPLLFQAWPIDGNDMVRSPLDGTIPLAQVSQAVRTTPEESP